MNISLNWLGSHLDLTDKSLQQIDDLFTFAGIEVEGIVSKGVRSEKIVVARILEAVQHANADRLKVTQVDCGEASPRQIVCGATNYQVGDLVPCALPGADLGNGFVIAETVMRKVESKGMLCSAQEIGLAAGADGLLILPESSTIGTPVREMFDSDTLLELEVTPNRPDLLSHRGMARELAALLEISWNDPAESLAKLDFTTSSAIQLAAPEACPFYSAVRITGITVEDSPAWLKQRLEAIGLRPINQIVDITNFILHEYGHPIHAFDAALVHGNICVRHARDGEIFAALDGSEHALTTRDLVISDDSGAALAMAGIMGGQHSGVMEKTTDLIIESAYFTPSGIRHSSRRTALSSDSSYRFERGADPAMATIAAAAAVHWILQLCPNAKVILCESAGRPPLDERHVELNAQKLDHLMGGSISLNAAEKILARLGLSPLGGGSWKIPSYRADLQRHIDLVEEVARVHGLGNVPSRHLGSYAPSSQSDAQYDADMILRQRLAALGFHECQTIKLIAESQLLDALPLRPLLDGDVIRVKLPLSEDHTVMRPSITPGLVASAERNARQQAKSLRLFEMGRVFRHAGGGKSRDQETDHLGILISGLNQPNSWAQSERFADLYDLKAALSNMLGGQTVQFKPANDRPGFALVSEIKIDQQTIGQFARLTPARERRAGFTAPVYLAEIDLNKIRKRLFSISQVEDLPAFPGSSRDAAMELPNSTSNGEIEQAISSHTEPLLVSYECFDLFADPSGQKLPADRKSLAYRFQYRTPDRTLTSDEVDAAHAKLIAHLGSKLPLKLR